MGKTKNWSKEELEYLEDNWGIKSIPTISKNLNRSISGVRCKAYNVGLGRHINQGEYVTLFQLIKAIGYGESYSYTVMKLEREKLPIKKKASIKRKYKIVYLNDFWNWLDKNKHVLSFAKFEKGALGAEHEWVNIKRNSDIKNPSKVNHNRIWTQANDSKLIFMCESNRYTYKDIAKELNRTENAIKRRLYDLGVKCRPVPLDNHIKWTKEEIKKLIDMNRKGFDSYYISIELKKSQLSITNRLKILNG